MEMENKLIAVLSCNGGTVTHGSGPATQLFVATLHGMHVFERTGQGALGSEPARPWKTVT